MSKQQVRRLYYHKSTHLTSPSQASVAYRFKQDLDHKHKENSRPIQIVNGRSPFHNKSKEFSHITINVSIHG